MKNILPVTNILHCQHRLAYSVFYLAILFSSGPLNAAETTESLSKFPRANRLWLSNASVEVLPANSRHYNSQSSGNVRILFEDGAILEKGSVWAIRRPDAMELNLRLHRVEELLTQEKIRDMELDYQDKIDLSREKLSELDQQRAKLITVLNSPQFSQNQSIIAQTQSTIKLIEAQIARANKRLQAQLDRSGIDSEIAKIELEEKRRALEISTERRSAELRAPFTGRIHYQFNLEDRGDPPFTLWIENGDPLATLINDQHYEIELPELTIDLDDEQKRRLVIRINAGNKDRSVEATFDRTEISVSNGSTTQKTFFRVAADDAAKAKKLLGSKLVASIYSIFNSPCHIVPKAYLLKEVSTDDPGATNWTSMAKECWPNSKLKAIGHLSLAIQASEQSGQNEDP